MRILGIKRALNLKSASVAAAVLAAVVVVSGQKAKAAVSVYSTAAAFDAATMSDTSYSFPVPPGGGPFQTVNSPYTVGPLSFSASELSDNNDGGYGTDQTYLNAGSAAPTSLSISLAGATALSFDIGTFFGSSPVTVAVNGVAEPGFTTSSGAPSTTFYGVTSDTPITSVSFSLGTDTELDTVNFQVGTANVPEPASLGLLAMGSLGLLRRRRRLL